MARITRPQLLHYINLGTELAPQYALVNKGVTSFEDSLEVETSEEHYIADQNATTLSSGVKASWSYTATVYSDDPVVQMLYNISADQTLNKTVDMVTVETWNGEKTALVARKVSLNVQPSKWAGGEAGGSLQVEGTLTQIGEPVAGTFNMTTKEFTATAEPGE